MTSSFLGLDTQTGKPVDISQSARRQGLYIIGAPGTGKTGLIDNLLNQDIVQGLGVGLLDPHGDLIQSVLTRLPSDREKDIIYLDLKDTAYPFGLNLYECASPADNNQVSYARAQVMHIFTKLWGDENGNLGTRIEEYLRNSATTLIEKGYTMAELPLLFSNKNARLVLTTNLSNQPTCTFWENFNRLKPDEQQQRYESTLNRADAFLQEKIIYNIIGQQKTTINLRDIMDERKILLVKLDARREKMTSLIGALIIAQVLNAAYSREDIEMKKRKQWNLYADEFQRFATEDFATLLSEARKFGVTVTVAHQFRDQLDRQNRSATLTIPNIVVLTVNGKDAEELAGNFDATPPQVEQAINFNPLEQFRHGRGHPNKRVNDIIGQLITPIFAELEPDEKEYIQAFFKSDRTQKNSISPIRDFLNNMNRFLVYAMQGKRDELPPLLVDILWGMYVLILRTSAKKMMIDTTIHRDVRVRIQPIFEMLKSSISGMGYFWVGGETWKLVESLPLDLYERYGAYENGNMPEGAFNLRNFYPCAEDTEKILTALFESWQDDQQDGHFSQVALSQLLHERCYYSVKKLYVKMLEDLSPIPEGMRQSTYWETLCTRDASMQALIKQAAEKGKQEATRIAQLVIKWMKLARLLEAQPIEERSASVPGEPTTYAETQRQIANTLANLPKYTAKCKVAGTDEKSQNAKKAEKQNGTASPPIIQPFNSVLYQQAYQEYEHADVHLRTLTLLPSLMQLCLQLPEYAFMLPADKQSPETAYDFIKAFGAFLKEESFFTKEVPVVIDLYGRFNPDHTDSTVQGYLLSTVYKPKSSLVNPTLRKPRQHQYTFNAPLPTPFETTLANIQTSDVRSEYPYLPWDDDPAVVTSAVAMLQKEYETRYKPLLQNATYEFAVPIDPTKKTESKQEKAERKDKTHIRIFIITFWVLCGLVLVFLPINAIVFHSDNAFFLQNSCFGLFFGIGIVAMLLTYILILPLLTIIRFVASLGKRIHRAASPLRGYWRVTLFPQVPPRLLAQLKSLQQAIKEAEQEKQRHTKNLQKMYERCHTIPGMPSLPLSFQTTIVEEENPNTQRKLISNEHIIRTLSPKNGLKGQELAERIARIQEQNRSEGYTRGRKEVEKEIQKRHEKLRQQEPLQSPLPFSKRGN